MPRIALLAAALLLGASPAFAQPAASDEAARTLEQNRRAVFSAPPAAVPARQASDMPPASRSEVDRSPAVRPMVVHPKPARPTGLALVEEASGALAR
ncbi:hypothetical protein GCM10011504_23110 [Siccirubricoccus deserti]|uniref:Uncharacterized protein n=1 Tax=Siccirubricoccus deserti TaxID=2013562 RepID=A0A9X0QXG6_9PROT|nr:hypothetical protein [Siccirubricoccus deserti]MBC4015726.1 hypothetical protein [Siccirubricoccus deserti]GGC44098.1 hypothetical protein GCM10011504_23110 [Siccirubricoccus deserti]